MTILDVQIWSSSCGSKHQIYMPLQERDYFELQINVSEKAGS